VEHQRRHATQWIIRRDLLGIAKRRPWSALETNAIKPHRNRGAADEGRVVLADKEHGFSTRFSGTCRNRAFLVCLKDADGRNPGPAMTTKYAGQILRATTIAKLLDRDFRGRWQRRIATAANGVLTPPPHRSRARRVRPAPSPQACARVWRRSCSA